MKNNCESYMQLILIPCECFCARGQKTRPQLSCSTARMQLHSVCPPIRKTKVWILFADDLSQQSKPRHAPFLVLFIYAINLCSLSLWTWTIQLFLFLLQFYSFIMAILLMVSGCCWWGFREKHFRWISSQSFVINDVYIILDRF